MLASVLGAANAVMTTAAVPISSGPAQDWSRQVSIMDWGGAHGATDGRWERDRQQVPNPLSHTGSWLNSVGLRSKSKTRGLMGEVTEGLVTGMRGRRERMGARMIRIRHIHKDCGRTNSI